jgi:hypothetical protein
MKSAQGCAVIPALLTRTGVFRYTLGDGSTRRELRLPEEVFAPKAMQSLETATLTVGHPGKVTVDNWKTLSVGDVRNVKKDGKYVGADVIVRDAVALKRVDSGDLVELSCGYDCSLEMRSGVHDGEAYDAIQRDLEYNHVGLGGEGWGRAGAEVRLRLDGSENAETGVTYTPAMSIDTELQARHDGLSKEVIRLNAELTRKDSEAVRLSKDLEKVSGERDALKSEIETARADGAASTARATELSDPKRIFSLVNERMTVIDGARALHGKMDIELGKSDREIMVAGLTVRDDKFDAKNKSDDYVRARFDMVVEQVKKAGKALGALNEGSAFPGSHDDGDELVKAQEQFKKNNKKAHQDWIGGSSADVDTTA